ncbi:DHA2 family efflux MFS transporter permease subunit [Amycolatopsis silviterrae]|uniref:DHA2 family efflux MFS transporter permease subunit n=1 Tax=Amycolatopsis silviterrae TaxID=1656914 RepID=A0ABW5H5E9_9PSEU
MSQTKTVVRSPLLAVAVFVGSFMALLDASVVSVALPTIQRELHAEFTDLQWIVDGYTVALAAVILTGGILGDRYGRKRIYLGGLAVFTIASLACGLAPTLGLLIAARVVQGIAAAAVIPGGIALLAHAYPEPRERARMMGAWGCVAGCALVIGPLVGGPITDAFGWPAIFLINLPIGAFAVFASYRGLGESSDPAHGALDLPGQVLGALWIGSFTYAVIASDAVVAVVGALGLAAFIVVELRAPHPMLPIRLFGKLRFATSILTSFVIGFACYPLPVLIAVYLQQAWGSTASTAGVQMLPYVITNAVLAFFSGQLSARFTAERVLPIGLVITTAGSFAFLLVDTAMPYWLLCVPLTLSGVGLGLSITPTNVVGLAGLPAQRTGTAAGTVNAARQVGMALGIAALGALLDHGSTLSTGLRTAMAVGGAALLAVTVLTAVTLRRAG